MDWGISGKKKSKNKKKKKSDKTIEREELRVLENKMRPNWLRFMKQNREIE